MESKTAEKNHHGENVRRWREWRGLNQDVLAEQIGISQATLSVYEKKAKLDQETLEKIAGVLNVPIQAITELEQGATINIFSGTWNDNAFAGNNPGRDNVGTCNFNPLDKVVELYDKLLKSEQEKVAILQGMQKEKK